MNIIEHTLKPRSSGLILGISLLLGLSFDYLFWNKTPGVSFVVFITLVLLGFFIVARATQKPIQKDLYWLVSLTLFFAAMVAIRANSLLTILNIFGTLLLLLLITEVSLRGSLLRFVPADYLMLLLSPFVFLEPFFKICSNFFSGGKIKRDPKRTAQAFRGILISAPIVILFALLFSAADPIFHEYLSFLNFDFESEIFARLILVLVIAVVCTGAYAYATCLTYSEHTPPPGKRSFGLLEASIVLGSINTLFFVFVITQLSYFFGGRNNIITEGLTYAEYARSGFFELLTVSLLSYLILSLTERYIEKSTEEHSLSFKWFSAALVLQIGVIMASAFSRLSLYEAAYGFTTLRLYVHVFIVFLGVIFISLLYKILRETQDRQFAFRTFLAVVIFLAGMNIINPDAFIAQKNLDRYEATGKLDAYYLSLLSSDAIDEKLKALEIEDELIRSEIGKSLYDKLESRVPMDPIWQNLSVWQSLNLSREEELWILQDRAEQLKAYRNYESQLQSRTFD